MSDTSTLQAKPVGSVYVVTKRIFDVIFSLIGLVLLLPLFLCVAAAIKATSKGPVFYRGIRAGRNGVPFRIFKFRSMVQDAERLGGTTTADSDPRVTKVGAFIRKYKIDELPQLISVLIGDMTFVGPRPEVFENTDLYVGEEKTILDVPPGITDYASMVFSDLQSHVGKEDAVEVFRREVLPRKNALRIKYVRERSFRTDLYILVKTTLIVAGKPFRKRKKDA